MFIKLNLETESSEWILISQIENESKKINL